MIATLETENLVLIPPGQPCFEAYLEFYTDPEASKAYGGPISSQQTWARLKADLGSWYLLGFGVWAVQEKASDRIVGTCGFWKGHNWPTELTWWVLPDARGKGIATEASIAAIRYAYEQLNWQTVETYMDDQNLAAHALVEKLGGYKNRRMAFPDGKSRDIYTLPQK